MDFTLPLYVLARITSGFNIISYMFSRSCICVERIVCIEMHRTSYVDFVHSLQERNCEKYNQSKHKYTTWMTILKRQVPPIKS
jgi:hypothetical protein